MGKTFHFIKCTIYKDDSFIMNALFSIWKQIQIFPMTKDVEHFFKCYSAVWDSFVENTLFSSVPHFVIGLFGSLEFNFLCSLYILDIRPLNDVRLIKIFPQSFGCCFILLTEVCTLEIFFFFIVIRSLLSLVDFRAWVTGVVFRKFSHGRCVARSSPLSLLFESMDQAFVEVPALLQLSYCFS